MISKLSFLIFFVSISLFAQQRALMHISPTGEQEIIPLNKGERVQDLIEKREHSTETLSDRPDETASIIDTLRYFPNESSLTTRFTWAHQDVALQWYTSAAGGVIKEVWWRNGDKIGAGKKATLRAWFVDPRLATRPAATLTKYLGAYRDSADGDGFVTPYKPATGDQWFYGSDKADSLSWNFDPLGTEMETQFKGGLQVNLDSGKWQMMRFSDWGSDTMFVQLGQMFGFTLSNDTKLSDTVGGKDESIIMMSYPNTSPAPYHSYKFYERGRTSETDKGWHLRGDYDWGMYVVVEYCTDRAPIFRINRINTFKTPVNVEAFIDGWGGCSMPKESVDHATLFYSIGAKKTFDSTIMILKSDINYIGTIPGAKAGDTVYFRVIATGSLGTRISSLQYLCRIFKKTQPRLLLYNNAQFPLGNNGANSIYNNKSPQYDHWSSPTDGTTELDTLLSLYDNVEVIDGSFPSRNVYPSLKKWLDSGTPQNKKNLFFSSQDYGCYIQSNCNDTSFAAGTFERDYLGIAMLGPQDHGPTNRPVKIVPQSDFITDYLLKYNADSSTTLWHYPTFELAFPGYPDFILPNMNAKVLFRSETGYNVFGIKNSGTGFNTVFLAFDAGALQFRSDTSLHNPSYTQITDPKYRWIGDVKSLSNAFFGPFTGVDGSNTQLPQSFSLSQNFPNPFNPSTTIQYSVGQRSNVQLSVFNVLGQKVAALVNEVKDPGEYTASFNGSSLSSGLYFYAMRAGAYVGVKKMMLLK